MKKRILALVVFMTLALSLAGCGSAAEPEAVAEENMQTEIINDRDEEKSLTDEQALSAIKSYCCISNPDLEKIVNAGDYPVYWTVAASDELQIVVLYRSYTGAQVRYYIDRITGSAYATESIPETAPEEEQTGEHFNAWDYLT